MDQDILHRLRLDPGQRTIGELIQDRATAAHEILDLRRQIERLRTVRSARKDRTEQPASQTHAFRPGSLIRISDVCDMVGTSRSTIYRWVAEGTFPAPVRISEKAIRWKVDDIEAWREALGAEPQPKGGGGRGQIRFRIKTTGRLTVLLSRTEADQMFTYTQLIDSLRVRSSGNDESLTHRKAVRRVRFDTLLAFWLTI